MLRPTRTITVLPHRSTPGNVLAHIKGTVRTKIGLSPRPPFTTQASVTFSNPAKSFGSFTDGMNSTQRIKSEEACAAPLLHAGFFFLHDGRKPPSQRRVGVGAVCARQRPHARQRQRAPLDSWWRRGYFTSERPLFQTHSCVSESPQQSDFMVFRWGSWPL